MGELQLQQWAEQLERERDEARAELERVRAERDGLQQQTMYDIALFGDEKLKAELAGARARLALVEPALRVARAFIDESRWRPGFYRGEPPHCGDCGTKQGGVHLADCGEEHAVRTIDAALAALDAAPPSSEPTKPPAPTDAGRVAAYRVTCIAGLNEAFAFLWDQAEGYWRDGGKGELILALDVDDSALQSDSGAARQEPATGQAASGEVPPLPGELCTCGRPAIMVFVTEKFGRVGYCGSPDGGGGNDVPKEPIEPTTAAAGTGPSPYARCTCDPSAPMKDRPWHGCPMHDAPPSPSTAEGRDGGERFKGCGCAWVDGVQTDYCARHVEDRVSESTIPLGDMINDLYSNLATARSEVAALKAERQQEIDRFQAVLVNIHGIATGDPPCDPNTSIGMATSAVQHLKAENERLQQTVADANASYRVMCDAYESARLEITRLERGNMDLAADLAAEREKVERMKGALKDAVELLDTLRHWGHENNCKSEDDQPCNCVIAENDRVSIAARAALAGTAGEPGKETL